MIKLKQIANNCSMLETDYARTLFSYESPIYKDHKNPMQVPQVAPLDAMSLTTTRHLLNFLGTTKKELREKIRRGEVLEALIQ